MLSQLSRPNWHRPHVQDGLKRTLQSWLLCVRRTHLGIAS
jgi:hypothetical protein